MRVLLAWPNLEATNAAGVRGRAFADGLARAGADVLVVAPPDPGAGEGASGWTFRPLALPRDPGDPLAGPRRELARLAKEHAPALVLASSPAALSLLVAQHATRGIGRFVADVRDLAAESLAAANGWKLKYRALRAAEGRVYRQSDAVLAVSGIMRERIVHDYGVPASRVHVVPNGADLEAFVHARHAAKDVDVLFSGAMTEPGRRGEEVVDAFADVRRALPGARMRFLGWRDVPYARALEERMRARGVRDAFDLAPPVPHDRIAMEVGRARVGVVPLQDAEVFRTAVGAKTYEYLAAGLPVVALGPRGDTELRRLLEGEGCGLYAEDAATFAKHLVAILGDRALETRLGKRALEVAARYHRPRLVDEAWTTILRPLAEGRR